MVDLERPEVLILIPIAALMAIEVGLPLSDARNEAVVPLIGKCPAAFGILTGNYGTDIAVATMECGIGVMLFLAIPGALGVGKMVLEQ
jgi:hypothetical protein